MDFESLKKVKEQVSNRDDIRIDSYKKILSEAYQIISNCNNTNYYNKEKLLLIANKLKEAINIKSNELEPYILLGNIFYIFGDVENAIKYLQYANMIDPQSPLVSRLRELIISKH